METIELRNCSMLDMFYNKSEDESLSSNVDILLAAGFSNITGIITVLFINVFLYNSFTDSSLKTKVDELLNEKTVSRTIALIILLFVMPIVTVFLLLALCYKLLCSIVIKHRDKYFVGFLDSFDVFWCLEDDTSKSIINVVGVIESESSQTLIEDVKSKLRSVLPSRSNDKIFYRRNEKYGFYYWRRYSYVDIEEYVQIIELPHKTDNAKLYDLEEVMTEVEHQSLPYDNEGLFQILITKERVGNYDGNRGDYGIIFRIHHSVGDGVALIEFLCKTLADETDSYPINMFSSPETIIRDSKSPDEILSMIQKLCEIPLCFVDGVLRKPDHNSLHGSALTGSKIFKWTNSGDDLLGMIKEIKMNLEDYKFSDILLMALSHGLNSYFLKTALRVPDDVAVVLPVRFPNTTTDSDPKLENDFSVTILDLPVKNHNTSKIKKRCEQIRNSADPLTNYYFLKIVSSVLPKQILQSLLNSSQATMVFSNLPGPNCLSICGGNVLKSLVFFVPHKGTTGLCVTALCYGAKLRFAAMADTALISDSDHLAFILDGMVDEIRRLHRHVTK